MSDIYAENHQLDPDPALETVTIPRAQHEALMEMVKALPIIEGGLRGLYISRFDCANMIRDNLAALRAAGIPEGE